MRYFVTGATGFIGGQVVRQLRASGHAVVAIARDPSRAQDLTTLGVEVVSGDITDPTSLRGPMTGADGVFHIAGWYKIGARDKTEGERINVLGTQNVLEVMAELGIQRGVYTSTLAVNSDTRGREVDETYRFTGTHLTVYDRTKAEAHHIAERFIARGLPLVIVQPGLVYGPGDTSSVRATLIQYLQRRLPLMPTGTSFSWGHVDDIATGHIAAMERGKAGENYFVCGPTHTFIEALEMAREITGVPLPALRAGPGLLKANAALMGLIERVAPLPEAYTREGLRAIAGVTYIGSNAKARRELGFDPRPLRIGLAETLRHEMGLLGLPQSSMT
ncbi:MAG TPA: NAD-dependent epimerase/dehydratase family protein [Anaerolineales bacterium]|nr:NAD-dependent epimerase/dehydratase family protein [Anaerolineales bacterium]